MRTSILKIFVFLLCLQNIVFAQETVIFQDNFSTNSNLWGIRDDASIYLQVTNGKYVFEHKRTENWWGTWKLVNIDTKKDFSISCNTMWLSGIDNNSYEMLWGLTDADNYYAFGITANGNYTYRMQFFGTSKNLIAWTKSDVININGSNKIAIEKIGTKLYFYINDVKVNEYKFDEFFGNFVGFGVNRNQKILFDDLKVSYIDKKVVVVEDMTPPEISVIEPLANRESKIFVTSNELVLKGKVFDNSGISSFFINGTASYYDQSGYFNETLTLNDGDNIVSIKATDNKNNTSVYTFYVNKKTETVVIQQKKIALVIGNSNYGGGQTLKNPVNDANLMAATLKNLGFDVILKTDADKYSMEQSVREFSKRLPDYNVALFYYAGHGVQVDGMNYLIPIGAQLVDKSDCKFEAISVNFIVEEFEKYPDNVNIVILDACRNDPFRSWARGGDRGFVAIAPTSGTIISFATSEGATASDGTGDNGLFTQELVKQMQIPQPIESVFKKTRVEVEKISNGAQSPQEWSKLKGDFYFKQ